MQRRQFIALLGGRWQHGRLRWCAATAIPTIGFLNAYIARIASTDLLVALRKGLKETGYVEGQNVTIEYRWAENQHERLSALVADLVRQQVRRDCIGGGVDAALAAKAATATIPIIFATGVDPVRSGLVGSLNRPGGNITGVFTFPLPWREATGAAARGGA